MAYSFNIDKIKEDSHSKYYWIGFISGDGSIQANNTRLRIELKNNSLDTLEKFKDFLESDSPITSRINNVKCECSRIDINSKELCEYLNEYNIVQNKTKTFTIPINKIPKEFYYDYIRGYMDADGCIHIRKNRNNCPTISFSCANIQPLEWIKSVFEITNKISFINNNYFLIKEGKKVKDILDKLYENSNINNRMNRKYDIYSTYVK